MCRGRSCRCSCKSGSGVFLSIYERSVLKGYTSLELDEWLQKLNDLIDGGVVDSGDTFSIDGVTITTIDGVGIDDLLSGNSNIQLNVESESTFASSDLITDVDNTTHQDDSLILEVNN